MGPGLEGALISAQPSQPKHIAGSVGEGMTIVKPSTGMWHMRLKEPSERIQLPLR